MALIKTLRIYHFSPGMPEMLGPSAALVGENLGKSVALVTDGRFSGASHGNISPLTVFVMPLLFLQRIFVTKRIEIQKF